MSPGGGYNSSGPQPAGGLKPMAAQSFAGLKMSVPSLQFLGWRSAANLEKRSESPIGTLSGILAPYNSLSCDLGGFKEIYQPGCFAECLKSNDDLLITFSHDPRLVLGRTGNKTAQVYDSPEGLRYTVPELPQTSYARDLAALMTRGDVSESSLAFYILQHRWENRPAGKVRIIEKAKFVEGGPVAMAAYLDTTAQVEQQQAAAAASKRPRVYSIGPCLALPKHIV
jgi:HK97 family phage prohead protease